MFTEFDISSGSINIHATVGPANGPPLVMLHGIGRRGSDLLSIVPALASRWHLHLIDHRGHGASNRAPGRYRVIDYVADAIAIVNYLGRPAVFYGHSLGALVAAAVAGARTELVQAVVLEDPPSEAFLAKLPETAYHATFTAMRRLAGSNLPVAELTRELGMTEVRTPAGMVPLRQVRDAASLRYLARCLQDVDRDVYTPVLEGRWCQGYDERSIWKSIGCPALLLRGDPALGGMLPDADAKVMTESVPDLTRVDIAGVGHLIHALQPETTTRHLLNFLESL